MKNWIVKLSKKEWNFKKTTSKVVLITLMTNILTPMLTYAALPSFGNNLEQPNIMAVAQVNEVKLPRDLVTGDILQLTVS